mmetsp:Transcript_30598/g.60036  ORF Transcript_30598/g.60036 Transcript_30598/m.60036 type:complete len:148 (-) Transcript_30598:90-533(-)|eukprot:CAMPEP_0172721650 /NCGR_PEP_ID=MMETSP1074-20121228/79601_1 /TAXON_ID=2916 /ORGANISM="Ceratium fusus, Strain PA161109" /LENGTH=147 /DNA_ID=CAMNT_0013547441 /DNA_START=78 /DNA_END=521 /DNA_ORIENTATION=-
MCRIWTAFLFPLFLGVSASEPLLAIVDATVTPSHTVCNVDGHAINITNIAAESVVVKLTGHYEGKEAGHETFSMAPHMVHTILACTSYGGYVLVIGGEMFNSEVQVQVSIGTSAVTDGWKVSIPQMKPWGPQIQRTGDVTFGAEMLI